MKNNTNWKLLSPPFSGNLNEALMHQYHASQYLAMVGRHLIAQKPDDSNTNFGFHPGKGMFIGHELSEGVRLGLDLEKLELQLLGPSDQVVASVNLSGKTTSRVYHEMKQMLNEEGIDTSNLKHELHYELLDHPLLKDAEFNTDDHKSMGELIAQRHNAELVLRNVTAGHTAAEPVRIWPHHFDTGSLIPLSQNNKGELSSSIGIGWAISDTMISEPYYYLSFWSAENVLLNPDMPAFSNGKWMMPDWNGGVLTLSDILGHRTEEEQMASVLSFFNEGIAIIQKTLES